MRRGVRGLSSLRGRLILAFAPLILCAFGGIGLFLALADPSRAGSALQIPLAIVALLTVSVVVLVSVLLARSVERSGRDLAGAAWRLGSGRLSERVEEELVERLPAELLDFAAAFNRMAADLQQLIQQLQAERERLSAVLERSADGVIAVDEDGRLRFMNPAARSLLDLGHRDLAADIQRQRSFMAVVRDHELDALLKQCRASGVQQTGMLQIGAHRRAVEAIFLSLRGAGEWQYLGLLHDLTEIRRVEGLRRDFVSNASHELRTPLASIRAAVEVLLDGALDQPEQAREFLADVNHNVDRLWQLVEELLELGRIESGQVPFEFAPIDPAALCEEAVRRMTPQAQRAGVQLSWNAAPGLKPVLADRERLLRALLNLVHNAMKFTPAGGSIVVEAAERADEIMIAVRDTGAGIPPEDLNRIFERFYKADRARSTAGTGLGLAIVKHTLSAHHGHAEVESTPGRGSTFRLLLPLAQAAGAGSPIARRAPH
jgi:two-component system phosphate regulon sensor histidine kinase PhoR